MEATEIKKKKTKRERPSTTFGGISHHDDILRTRYPKKCPTYLVAFSLKETYDDLVVAQQMICKRSLQEHSPQGSNNSITPSNSLKMHETEQMDKNLNATCNYPDNDSQKNSPDSITPTNSFKMLETEQTAESSRTNVDKYSDNRPASVMNSPHNSIYSVNSSTPSSSLKSRSDYSGSSFITIGEKEKVNINLSDNGSNVSESTLVSCDVTGHLKQHDTVPDDVKEMNEIQTNEAQITVYVYEKPVSNPSTVCLTVDETKGNMKENQEVKVNNNIEPESLFKAVKKNHVSKKRKTFRRKPNNAVKIKQKKFKCKLSKKKIDVRLEKYYEKRNNSIDAYQIQMDFYSDKVSTIVSRTKFLHKIKARENLLDNADFNTNVNEYDDISLTSSLSTARKTLLSVSDSSQNTLVQELGSACNINDALDTIEINHVRSLLKMPLLTPTNTPYKSDLISIPVTVAFDKSTVDNSSDENNLLTSQEELIKQKGSLTSSEGAIPLIFNYLSQSEKPNMPNMDGVAIEPSENTLVNTKSSFGMDSSNEFFIARGSSQFSKSNDSRETLKNDKDTVIDINSTTEDSIVNKEAMIFETVINLDRNNSESSPVSSSDTLCCNNVIVANAPNDMYLINPVSRTNKDSNLKNVLVKSTTQPNEKVVNQIINLPNQEEIKALLNERDIPQQKCGDEIRNLTSIPPLWDRLISALEVAVHKLEDNIVEKIMKEIQRTCVKYEPKAAPSKNAMKTDVDSADNLKNLSVQCDLVNKATIDHLMEILSSEGPKIKENLLKVDLYKDFEVLKPPQSTRMLTERGDNVTVSTLTCESRGRQRFKMLASVPVSFVRENMFVITGVPTFFVFLLCVYGLIMLLMKPW